MDDERVRKMGVASGMVHALVMLGEDIGYRTYYPLPRHHKRRIREREMEVAPLRKAYERLEGELRRLQAHIAESK